MHRVGQPARCFEVIMQFKTLSAAVLAAALLAPALAGSAFAQSPTPDATPAAPTAAAPATGGRVAPAGDIIQTLQAAGQFSTLLKALDATNLTGVLKGAGPLTLFAPTDAAFAALPPGQLDQLMSASPPAALQKLLVYHIINARVDSTKIRGSKGPIPTAAGTSVYVNGSAEPMKVNDATIVQADVTVSNGVIHVVDHVLSPTFTPPPAAAADAAPATLTSRKRK
jgi:uncharacterized surface protein with fasciclin (FAS1) repeats